MTFEGAPTTGGVCIVLAGVVDAATAASVADAVRDGLTSGPVVQVDIRGVHRWEDDALGTLAACTRMGAGVEFRVDGRRPRPAAAT